MLFTLNQRWIVGIVGAAMLLFLFLLHQMLQPNTTRTFGLTSLAGLGTGRLTQTTEIPNIIHFVHLVRGSNDEPILEIAFWQFVAIYSAQYYLNPDTIYIHTMIGEHQVEASLNASSTPYSRVLARMPNVVFNQVSPPLRTSRGKYVYELAHRSDLVRVQVLKKWGGLYLDEDSYLVRDLQPFRDSGFKTIVGLESDEKIKNAVMLSAPESNLITAFEALQDRSYDGGNTAHSVDLLTSLAQDFSGSDKEVLILPRQAFFRIDKESLLNFYHADDIKSISATYH